MVFWMPTRLHIRKALALMHPSIRRCRAHGIDSILPPPVQFVIRDLKTVVTTQYWAKRCRTRATRRICDQITNFNAYCPYVHVQRYISALLLRKFWQSNCRVLSNRMANHVCYFLLKAYKACLHSPGSFRCRRGSDRIKHFLKTWRETLPAHCEQSGPVESHVKFWAH